MPPFFRPLTAVKRSSPTSIFCFRYRLPILRNSRGKCSSLHRPSFRVFFGKLHGASHNPRKPANVSAYAPSTVSSIPSAPPCNGTDRARRPLSGGMLRCPVRRKWCPRISIRSSTRRRRRTGREFTNCRSGHE